MARKKTPKVDEAGNEIDDGTSLTVRMYSTNDQTAVTIGDQEYEVDESDGSVEVIRTHVPDMLAHGFTLKAPKAE